MPKDKGTPLTTNEIRQALWTRINRAQTYHDLFRDIDRSGGLNLVKFNRNLRFFRTCESALHDATIVALYSLYETPNDRVGFRQLVNAIPEKDMPPDLKREFLTRIQEIMPTWRKVSIVRNEIVGHQTNRAQPDEIRERANLNFACVDKVLSHSRQLLFDVSSRCMDTHIDFMTDTPGAAERLFSQLADPMMFRPA